MVDKRMLDFLRSDNWKIKVYDIIEQWDDLIDNKSAYADNEDTIDLEAFAVLAENTYNIIEELRYASIHLNEETTDECIGHSSGNCYESFTRLKKHLIVFYVRIIACVRAYSVMDCFTENTEYKASVAVARELNNMLSSFCDQKEPIILMALADGNFRLNREYSKKELNKEYIYDIRKHDFREMLDFAERIN